MTQGAGEKPKAAHLANTNLFFLCAAAYLCVWAGYVPIDACLGALAPDSLLALVAPRSTVAGMFGWFVLLPSTVAFLGIGAPALVGLFRERAASGGPRSGLAPLVALLLATALMLASSGIVSLLALLAALTTAVREMGRVGLAIVARRTWLFAFLAAAGLAGLNYLAYLAYSGQDPGFALAPTAALAFVFFGFGAVMSALAGLSNVTSQSTAPPIALLVVALLGWGLWPVVALSDAGGQLGELIAAATCLILLLTTVVLGFRANRVA